MEVASFISEEITGSGQMIGYRMMHLKCIQKGFTVKRETVWLQLSVLDPYGVAYRRARRLRRRRYHNLGPNIMWHIDSYDKLKTYSLCINGCVDGFSRNVMWLKVYFTNNEPKVIATYFIETVKNRDGCPRRIHADRALKTLLWSRCRSFFDEMLLMTLLFTGVSYTVQAIIIKESKAFGAYFGKKIFSFGRTFFRL
ncbi:hypothetical protein PO909_013091 [Leuciscus waleckii]